MFLLSCTRLCRACTERIAQNQKILKEVLSMSEKEKNIIRRLSDTVPKLDKDKQNYILGVAEGMAIAKDGQRDKQLRED